MTVWARDSETTPIVATTSGSAPRDASQERWGFCVPVPAGAHVAVVTAMLELIARDLRLPIVECPAIFRDERALPAPVDGASGFDGAMLEALRTLASPAIGWTLAHSAEAAQTAFVLIAAGVAFERAAFAELAFACGRTFDSDPATAASHRALAWAPSIDADDDSGAQQRLGLPCVQLLPGGRARDAAGPAQLRHSTVSLPAASAMQLASLATVLDSDVSDLLLAAFAAVLERSLSVDQIDLSAGVHRNRTRLQIDLTGDPAFPELVARTRQAREASRRDDAFVPPPIAFEFVDDIGFVDDTGAQVDAREAILIRHMQGAAICSAAFDLRVLCAPAPDGVRLRFEFDRQVYDDGLIARLATRYTRFLENVWARVGMRISEVPLTDAAERSELLAWSRGERRPYDAAATVTTRWRDQLARTPDAVAVLDEQNRLTYAAVEGRANQLAHHLSARGVVPGSPVGVSFERSRHLPIVLLAILKAGGYYVPLDPTYPSERLEMMIADANIRVAIGNDAGPPLPASVRTISLESDEHEIDARSTRPPAIDVAASDWAYVTYTSGSTGRPKGVCVTHRGVVRLVTNVDYAQIQPGDGFLQHAPLAFDASTFEIWAPLLSGGRLGIPRAGLLTMAELAKAIETFDVTTMFLTTSLFGRLVESELPGFGRLRQLLTGGEVASPAHMCRFIQAYPACRLIAVYGPTENTTFSTWHPLPTVQSVGTNVPIGRPIANSTAYVVDVNGELAARDVPGELWVGGAGVASGYLHRPELSGQRFCADPFDASSAARVYKTGDRARWRADGVLEFLGRTDNQVKVRGFRIELGEIESVLQAHPMVAQAAVVSATLGGETAVAAFVVPRVAGAFTEADLRTFVTAKLPRYMHPNRTTILSTFPQHASGKIDRVALAHRATLPQIDFTPPLEQRIALQPLSKNRKMQHIIADVWRAALNIDVEPHLDQNFFDAGGDSLRLLTVHAALVERLGRDIQIMDLFQHTTIRTLATKLSLTGAPA